MYGGRGKKKPSAKSEGVERGSEGERTRESEREGRRAKGQPTGRDGAGRDGEKEKGGGERFIYARGYREALRLRSHDDDDRARRHEFASFTRS